MEQNKSNLIYAGLIGAIAGSVLPCASDWFYFSRAKDLRDQWTNGDISAKAYWGKKTTEYYLWSTLTWTAILGIVYATDMDYNSKIKLLIGIVAGGAVITVVANNIKKDQLNKATELNKARKMAFDLLTKDKQDELIKKAETLIVK